MFRDCIASVVCIYGFPDPDVWLIGGKPCKLKELAKWYQNSQGFCQTPVYVIACFRYIWIYFHVERKRCH